MHRRAALSLHPAGVCSTRATETCPHHSTNRRPSYPPSGQCVTPVLERLHRHTPGACGTCVVRWLDASWRKMAGDFLAPISRVPQVLPAAACVCRWLAGRATAPMAPVFRAQRRFAGTRGVAAVCRWHGGGYREPAAVFVRRLSDERWCAAVAACLQASAIATQSDIDAARFVGMASGVAERGC